MLSAGNIVQRGDDTVDRFDLKICGPGTSRGKALTVCCQYLATFCTNSTPNSGLHQDSPLNEKGGTHLQGCWHNSTQDKRAQAKFQVKNRLLSLADCQQESFIRAARHVIKTGHLPTRSLLLRAFDKTLSTLFSRFGSTPPKTIVSGPSCCLGEKITACLHLKVES